MNEMVKKAACLLALGTVAVFGLAQDFPTLKGDTGRTGKSANPNTTGPGRGLLSWYKPNPFSSFRSVIRDNTSTAAFGTGGWLPPIAGGEASLFYAETDDSGLVGTSLNPPYLATTSVLASPSNPLVPASGTDPLETFTWTLDPGTGVAGGYALYVWLPTGPSQIATGTYYPQRYFIYSISLDGGATRVVEVVDTFLAGSGLVRLGGGGAITSQLYRYNGVDPIQITLYNTRLATDELPTPTPQLVYADAAFASQEVGSYASTPTVRAFGPEIRALASLNRTAIVRIGTEERSFSVGAVTSYNYNDGLEQWRFSPQIESPGIFVDDASSNVTYTANWTPETSVPNYRGVGYRTAPVDLAAATETATYSPDLPSDDTYAIYAWIPGDGGTGTFGTQVQYEILVNGSVVQTVTVDQSAAQGWVRLGADRFEHLAALPLQVRLTNYSLNAGDAGRVVYADTVRFVGNQSLSIVSTPVQTSALLRLTPSGTPVETPVAIIPAEDGRIYCVDAVGNGDGTTQVYWVYPSLPNPDNPSWTDPNAVAGEDGSVAQMPTGFDLSSALVERIGGVDYLYIASRNGRVYCIEMTGRGDMNLTLRTPGTTRRVWSFPDDFPAVARGTTLGAFRGSVAFANTTDGPTIFVPAPEGRLYALDAVGNPVNKTTTVRWAYPARTSPTLGSIQMTPVVDSFGGPTNRVYFGTAGKSASERGAFYALDADTGTLVWRSDAGTQTFTGASTMLDDFVSGPATVDAATIGGAAPVNTLFVANSNRYVYALDADTGALLWETRELNSIVTASLGYSQMTVFNNLGGLVAEPVVLVPTRDGQLAGFFARPEVVNVSGGRRAYQYNVVGELIASLATGHGHLYAADGSGVLYSFSTVGGGSGPDAPGSEVIVENDPSGAPYRHARLKIIDKAMYDRLLENPTTVQYNDLHILPDAARTAFEWGETAYVVAYGFPYDTVNAVTGDPVQPAIVDFEISADGKTTQRVPSPSRLLANGGALPPLTPPLTPPLAYAVIAFAFQDGGRNSMPPGSGTFSMGIRTHALSSSGAPQVVAQGTADWRRDYQVANPLALVTGLTGANADPLRQIGMVTDPSDPGALANGSPDLTSTTSVENQLRSSAGVVSHGQAGATGFWVADRSLMTLLRGPQRSGLANVKIDRQDLAWQNDGVVNIFNRLPAHYDRFEDYPDNYPNDSLDYPDISRLNVTFRGNGFNGVSDPVYRALGLLTPLNGSGNPLGMNDVYADRELRLTPVDVSVRVPRYQPTNLLGRMDSRSLSLPSGYSGGVRVYVDTNNNRQFDSASGTREAYREMHLGASVPPDQRMSVGTPTVDLGSMAAGSGFTPLPPIDDLLGAFNPWEGPYADMFKSFVVRNEGNVNLLNMRLAKGTQTGGVGRPWLLRASGNETNSWLDGGRYLWSDLDPGFVPGGNSVALKKPRVGDRVPSELAVNPRRRANPNTQATGDDLDVLHPDLLPSGELRYPVRAPRVAVTPPIGQPIGTYQSLLRVIQDQNPDLLLEFSSSFIPQEVYTDPGFNLTFRIREGRLTNRFTEKTAPMLDDPTVLGPGGNFAHANMQPAGLRDPNGNLVVAWVSDRSSMTAAQPTDPVMNPAWKIYLGSLQGAQPTTGAWSMNDLSAWNPGSANQWFKPAPVATGYPVEVPNALFDGNVSNPIVNARYGSPAFPSLGFLNPLASGSFSRVLMAFVGTAQRSTPTGIQTESRLFIAPVQVSVNGDVSVGAANGLRHDPQIRKGRPSVIQLADNRALMFYAGVGAGYQQLFYTRFEDGAFTDPLPIRLGVSFEEVGAPSASIRPYLGADPSVSGTLIDLTFSGKLRGRSRHEVFYMQLRANAQGVPQAGGIRSLGLRTEEELVSEGRGVYRSVGLLWHPNTTPALHQRIGNGAAVNLLEGTPEIDRETGRMVYNTRLGGKVYLEPATGIVRFTGTNPSPRARLLLTYEPQVLRMSQGASGGYQSPTQVYDFRFEGSKEFWREPGGASVSPAAEIRRDRFLFAYNRSAAGRGEAARPMMRTWRFGVQLPSAIHTAPDGTPTGFTLTGAAGRYQLDPANGRVYFTAEDEDASVTIQYIGADEATGAPLPARNEARRVGLIGERDEEAIPIEQAVNESNVTMFLDPFTLTTGARPGLLWLLWTSTRAGSTDLYYQTIAPRLTPVIPATSGN